MNRCVIALIGLLAAFNVDGEGVTAEMLLAPVQLRGNYLVNPIGLDAANVADLRFSWRPNSSRQTAYQVIVVGGWDSGKIESSVQNGIRYAGPALVSKTAYTWKVRTWNQDGSASDWSEPATFETGILDSKTDWKGSWVGGPSPQKDDSGKFVKNQYNIIRRSFELPADRRIAKARAYVAAKHYGLSFFVFKINGQMPAGAVPLKRGIYTFDVTSLLKAGKNVFGAMFGDTGNPRKRPDVSSQNGLLCDLDVWFEDGSHTNISTDAECRGLQGGPVISADMYDGEDYDARRELAWDLAEFNDKDWSSCIASSDGVKPGDAVLNHVSVYETRVPEKLTNPVDGVIILDAGTQISGWAQIRVSGQAGQRVKLRFAERLNKDGTIDMSTITNGIPANQTDYYTLRGGGEEIWEPALTYHGFRYVEVTDWPGIAGLENFKFRRAAADVLKQKSEFECSNPLLNRIERAFYDTEVANLMFEHTACNQRAERAPWSADVMCIAEASMTYFDVAQFFQENWLDICRNRVGPHGEAGNLVCEAGGYSLLWQSHCVKVAWDYYEAYGDVSYLAPCYGRAKKFADCLVNWLDQLDEVVFDRKKNYIVSHVSRNDYLIDAEAKWRDPEGNPHENMLRYWGDWLRPDRQWEKNASFITSAYYYHCLDLTARMAEGLVREDDSKHYRDLADKVRNAINGKWLKENRYYCDNDQTPNALALDFGIVPENARAAVIESLVADIKSRTNHLATGCIGTLSLIPALAENGRNDVAFALATQRSYPSWLYMLDIGPGTFWEHWNDEAMSKCHMFMGGSISTWLYRSVAGIKPMKPGYAEIEFKPEVFGDLIFARATVATVRGAVSVNWKKSQDKLELDITVPANSVGIVHIPVLGKSDPGCMIRGNGVVIWSKGRAGAAVSGLKYRTTGRESVVFDAGPGNYKFAVEYK